MKSMRNEFLAAAAAVALMAASGGVLAQDAAKPGAQGDVKVDTNAQKPAGAKAGAQTQGGSAQTKTEGGAKVDAQAPKGAQSPSGTQAQGRDGGSEAKGKVDAQAPKGAQDKDSQRSQAQSDEKPPQLNDQQRTRISTTIREHKDVRRVERTRVNFNISVGVAVPRSFTLYPLPAPILAVVPAYRGYLYIVVGDDLLIIHPRTYEIVAVIPA